MISYSLHVQDNNYLLHIVDNYYIYKCITFVIAIQIVFISTYLIPSPMLNLIAIFNELKKILHWVKVLRRILMYAKGKKYKIVHTDAHRNKL